MKKSVLSVIFVAAVSLFTTESEAITVINDGATHTINYHIGDYVYVRDSYGGDPTTVKLVSGGYVEYMLSARDNSRVNVSGGQVGDTLRAREYGHVAISGGVIGKLHTLENGQAVISGGQIGSLAQIGSLGAYGNSQITWSGGEVMSSLYVHDNSVLTIHGTGFNYPPGEITDWSGTLTGTLASGEVINNEFRIYQDASIILVSELPPGTTLSGIVFDDKNDNRTYNPGEEVSGALISTGEGTPVTSGSNGRYMISELTPPDVWLQVTIDGDDYWAYCHIEDGENQFDIMINSSAEDQFNVCSANVSCATGFAGLLPYVGKAADHVSVALDICATKQRLDAGDVLGATIGIVKLTVNFLNTLIEDAVFIITGSAAETPYQLVDAVEASINCAESHLYEYLDDHCGGYTSCLWEGFTAWIGESIGIFTGSPVDIRVIDSQGNVMELDANGYTKNELSSPGWIFKGPDDKELALIFDADDDYTVLIVGRPEAGASSTFYLQMMQQSAGGSQQIHTYTNVSISAQGVAFAQIGDNPVLEVDVDGDGTVDLNLLPDSLAMQVVPLLPSSDKNKAGRTMPVKFSLRKPERVDPAMPFVYDEDLEIRIYDSADPGTILQTSRHGDTARDYRIDTADELYITNFRTKKEPAEYVVEIWRTDLAFQVGSFTLQTLK